MVNTTLRRIGFSQLLPTAHLQIVAALRYQERIIPQTGQLLAIIACQIFFQDVNYYLP
jgi:hypothetical protein